MTNKTREVLDTIDALLVNGDQTSVELWEILTALRGPDDDDECYKSMTTMPIRAAAFPHLYQASLECGKDCGKWYVGAMRFPGMPLAGENTQFIQAPSTHFGIHANAAAQHLGLLNGTRE